MRGLDVFALQPSEYLSANEIAAAEMAIDDGVFNPQQQFALSWPADPVVAGAYVDQLERRGGLDARLLDGLEDALAEAGERLAAGSGDAALATRVESLAAAVAKAEGVASSRLDGLVETLSGIAERLR